MSTDDAGIVTVKGQGTGEATIDDQQLSLIPQDSTGTTMNPANMPTIVFQWKCVKAATNPINPTYLPGSCK